MYILLLCYMIKSNHQNGFILQVHHNTCNLPLTHNIMTTSNLGDGETTGPFTASNGIIDIVLNSLVDNQFYIITLWDETEGTASNTVTIEFSKYKLRVDMFHFRCAVCFC